jgi:UDPglucose 6-dehydrogenase
VVGAGYVGLVTAVCLADSGVEVRLHDIVQNRMDLLREGTSPIHEPMLEELLRKCLARHSLILSPDVGEAVRGSQLVMIAVGTPPLDDGRADLGQVRAALSGVVARAEPGTVIVIKSTVPPGTTAALKPLCKRNGTVFPLLVCPEFLSEGTAVADFLHPATVVIGGDDMGACGRLAALFQHLGAPVTITDSASAELIKYGVNSFLALKISFINEIAHLCDLAGADVSSVADGIGADPRVGKAFLGAGLGFGGSCFPKDVRALDQAASYLGHSFWLLRAAVEVNAQQRVRFVAKVQKALKGSVARKRIAVLGLAFKPGTSDMRHAPSLDVVRHLQDLGARVVATDPLACSTAQAMLPQTEIVEDPYACIDGADAVVVVTEWPEFVNLDWQRAGTLVRRRLVIDGRNCMDADALTAAGFTYISVGRPVRKPRVAQHRDVDGEFGRELVGRTRPRRQARNASSNGEAAQLPSPASSAIARADVFRECLGGRLIET